jgi:AmmeMemoRadiSam system protein B
VAYVMDALWQDESTVIVVSTDLSHYHDHATAGRLDRRTAEAIVGVRRLRATYALVARQYP